MKINEKEFPMTDSSVNGGFPAESVKPSACSVIYEFNGEPDAKGGWSFLPAEVGRKVYIPFEGIYESKGGKIRSPEFPLKKRNDQATFYRLSFTAQAAAQGYWWVDFYDENRTSLPDINSALYASEEPMRQEGVFFADPRACSARISFVTMQGVYVRDVRLEQISPAEAAAWCDNLYASLPQKTFFTSGDAFVLLPGTKAALNNGTFWRILMLGDSIVNDTWCSNFQALVMRDFPKARLDFRISVRGSTGVWFYREPMHFQEYVGRFKPDLVMIGGISNVRNQGIVEDPENDMNSVIQQCRDIGAEVVVMSPALSYKWRKTAAPAPWSENWVNEKGWRPYRRDYQFAVTEKTRTAYWDLTTVPCSILSDCLQESSWFSRDEVHNNDRGKQLIGQNLAAWFRMAKE